MLHNKQTFDKLDVTARQPLLRMGLMGIEGTLVLYAKLMFCE
jgi:hypothetical protein